MKRLKLEEMDGKVLQPFTMEIAPIKKLLLLNFEKNPEAIYTGLELQYLETELEGKGFRVIAYRNDRYVDVYDEESLYIKELGKFEVCDKGLKHYRKTRFDRGYFQLTEEGIHAEFYFHDYKGRLIDVVVQEHGKKPSRAFDLIAPIGVSSRNPVSFPAFAMYQFDLVRKKNTVLKIQIDGKEILPDAFPVPIPKDGQMRYFTRYGYDCELVEFGKKEEVILRAYDCNKNELHEQGLIATYKTIEGMQQMESLRFQHSKHTFILKFEDLFPDLLHMKNTEVIGRFRIEMDQSMGYFSGEYKVIKQGEQVEITMIPCDGWIVQNKMFLTKIMFQKKSVFRTWPKTYYYKQDIDLHTGKSSSHWERIDYKELTADWWKGK